MKTGFFSRRNISLAAWIGLTMLLALILAGFLLVPMLAHRQLEQRLTQLLDRTSQISSVSFNPFRLRLIVKGLQIEDRRRDEPASAERSPLLRLDRLEARLSWRSLFQRTPIVDRLLITTPQVSIRRLPGGRYNIADWLEPGTPANNAAAPADPPSIAASKTPARFSVANIELNNGLVRFDDAVHGQRHRIEEIMLGLPFLSSLPIHQQIYVQPRLAGRINNTPFDLKGRSRPFAPDRESTLDLVLAEIDLARYVEYVPTEVPVKVSRLPVSLSARLEFLQPPNSPASVVLHGRALAQNPEILERNNRPLFAATAIEVTGLVARPLEATWGVESVKLFKPAIYVQRLSGDRGWFDSFVPVRPAAQDKKPVRWQLDRLLVESGQVYYRDEQFQPQTLAQEFGDFNAEVGGLSSDPASEVSFKASNTTPLDEVSNLQGRMRVRPFELDAQLSLTGLKLVPKWWIVQPYVNAELTEGQADTRTRVRVSVLNGEVGVRLSDLELDVNRLVLRQPADRLEFLRLPMAKVRDAGFDLIGKRIELGRVESTDTRLELRRDAQGRLNVEQLARANTAAAGRQAIDRPASSNTSPWTVTLASLNAERQRIEFKDTRAGKAGDLSLHDLTLRAEQLSTATGVTGKVSLQSGVNKGGRISAAGPLSVVPLATTLKLEMRDVSMVPIEAYVAGQLNALITSGFLQAQGELGVALPRAMATGQPAATAPVVRYKGSIAVSRFGLVDKTAQRDILRWTSLQANDIDFVSQPLAVKVGEVLSEDLRAQLVLESNGRLNLRDLWKSSAEAASAAASTIAQPAGDTPDATRAAALPMAGVAAANSTTPYIDTAQSVARNVPINPRAPPAPPASNSIAAKLQFGSLVLRNGSIDFTDLFVTPNYRARLVQLEGKVTQITPSQAGKVDLRGRLNDGGRVDIAGELNPLAANVYLDLQARAGDVELPGLSTYSRRYLGYGIEKGKLSATLKYFLQDRKLSAENRVVLDQLTFGEKVESPTAIKAPVLFAVSLLKDRNGVIDVNLPIGGTLDDPQFSVGAIIWQVIGNLIVKAVTAPFSLLAGLVGGSETELSKVEFAAGGALLDETAIARLKAVSKGLADRPGLKLELAGRVDQQRDTEVLRTRRLERQLKAEKLRETVGAGDSADAIDRIVLDPADRERLLKKVFDSAGIEPPRDAQGKARAPSRDEMGSQLLGRQPIGEADLLALAAARARAVKTWLETEGAIEPSRVFLLEPRLEQPGAADAGAASRVDLLLK